MKGFFITATGTDIGKTLLTSLLIRLRVQQGLPAHALKPVMTGMDAENAESSDSAFLLSVCGKPVNAETVAAISPWQFAAPISPHLAAAREAKTIPRDALLAFCRTMLSQHPFTFIEGVGGVMVPLGEDWTVRDWMAELQLPAILVVGSYLGSFSHTLSAVEALRAKGITLSGIAVSLSEKMPVMAAEQRQTLESFCKTPLMLIPRLDLGHAPFHDRNERLDMALARMEGFHDWAKACGVA